MARMLRFAPVVTAAAVGSWVLLSATTGLAPQAQGFSSLPMFPQQGEDGPSPVSTDLISHASEAADRGGPGQKPTGTTSSPCYADRCVVATVPVGKGPDSGAYDGAKSEVFVANENSNDVSVVRDSNYTLVGTIPVGNLPTGIAYDAGKGEVFVANSGSANVSVISDATNSVVASIPLNSSGSKEVAYDPAKNEIFVTNDDVNGVYVIDDGTNKVVDTIPVGSYPVGVICDAGRGEVFVSNFHANTVSVIDDSNDYVVAVIPVGT